MSVERHWSLKRISVKVTHILTNDENNLDKDISVNGSYRFFVVLVSKGCRERDENGYIECRN